ncbi:MAG TPA: hypothetical protein VF139_01425 [Candidatus Polarisedimenticolaceae bacterium]
MTSLRLALLLALGLAGTLAPAQAQFISLQDVSPVSVQKIPNPSGTGGRVNGLAVDPTAPLVMYAATEWGGLYKTTDGGRNWFHLPGHRATVTWDVEVDPSDPQRVIATSFYDGRTDAQSGINVSSDGGLTWTRPVTAVPPTGFCSNPDDQVELSAFGISIAPSNPSVVYVGTSCGLAISNDYGSTWSYVKPPSTPGGSRVWDVVASADGQWIDFCGDDGHHWYRPSAGVWGQGSGLPSGICSLAASPYSPNNLNLIATVGTKIYETTAAGIWTETRTNPLPQGRIPFVATNKLSDPGKFDLWFGDVLLYRVQCDDAATGPKCGTGTTPAWSANLVDWGNGYGDQGEILFDPTVSANACPLLNSADGGVVYNQKTTHPACQTPAWKDPVVSVRALWPWALAGLDVAGPGNDHVFFGNQDNGVFGTADAATFEPFWRQEVCCDGFDAVTAPATDTDDESLIYSVCCGLSVVRTNADMTGDVGINLPPGGSPPGFQTPDVLVRWGPKHHAMLTRDSGTDGGLFITENIEATPVVWTELGNNAEFPSESGCAVYAATNAATFYVQTGNCNGEGTGDQLWKYVGTDPAQAWTQVVTPATEGIGIFALDPTNASRLAISALHANTANMYLSNDGGTTWTPLPSLDAMMNGGGDFRMRTLRGPTNFTGLGGYHQPSLVAFDPFDASNILAGGRDSGIFYSTDFGTSWTLATDPRNSHTSGTPHVPRPKHAYFSEADHDKSIYVSSQGRGVWRFGICEADAFEPDDEDGSAKTITSGETQQRSICGTGNPDYARFIVAEPSSGAISTSGSSGSLNVKLLNDQLQVVAEAPTGLDVACGSPQVLRTGRYSIVVEEPGQDDTIASYTLSLNLSPCCGNAAIDATAGEACDDGNRVDGDCCSSVCALENTPIPAITAATMTSTQITWPASVDTDAYDVVVGDLGMLRQSGGEFSGSTLLCLADDDPATSVDHTSVAPFPGGAAYFLVRGVKCGSSGTFDDLGPRLAQSRDGELAASGLPCTTP